MYMKKIDTELVLEIASKFKKTDGFQQKTKNCGRGIFQTNTIINSESASKKFGKEIGEYVSFTFDDLLFFDVQAKEILTNQIIKSIKSLFQKTNNNPKKILVVGLGNDKYACDSLGNKVTERTLATKPYLDKKLFTKKQMKEVYTIIPGVFGQTGLESLDIIKSVCSFLKPDLVVVIDSMVAGKTDTLARSVQISGTSLSPGGGVGNTRKEFSKKTLGTNILAIGVPMVVNLKQICDADENLIVSPKDVEQKVSVLAKIIAKAINKSFCNLTEKQYDELTK